MSFDKAARTGAVDMTVHVRSVYSGSKGFAQHLLAPDLFDAAKHPRMRFVSERQVFEGERLLEVPGRLTLFGQAPPVTLRARQFICYANQRAKTEACAGAFDAVVDSTQWGMNHLVDKGMPKAVHITATIEAFKQQRAAPGARAGQRARPGGSGRTANADSRSTARAGWDGSSPRKVAILRGRTRPAPVQGLNR